MVKAILTKPLDGKPEGTEREFSKADFDRLQRLGAVRGWLAHGGAAACEVRRSSSRSAGISFTKRETGFACGMPNTERVWA